MWFSFCASRRRHTRCTLVTGVQTCPLPIWRLGDPDPSGHGIDGFRDEAALEDRVLRQGLDHVVDRGVRHVGLAQDPLPFRAGLLFQDVPDDGFQRVPVLPPGGRRAEPFVLAELGPAEGRSEEHTSELQSLMRISYAVFCLKKKMQTTIK